MTRATLIEIDLHSVATANELHQLLMESLDFPGWYGCNWDAFWDAITGLVEMPEVLRLVGWAAFETRMPDEAKLMRECLDEMAAQFPSLAPKVDYLSAGDWHSIYPSSCS